MLNFLKKKIYGGNTCKTPVTFPRHVGHRKKTSSFFHLSIDEPSFVEIVVIVVVCLLDESLSRPIGALEARDEMATRKQRARSRIRIAYDARRSLLQFFDVIL
jgi:hypothetical protein